MSARLRLTLSYAVVLALAGVAFLLVAYSVIRFVPYGNLTEDDGFVPNRGDLLQVLWPRAVGGMILVVGVGSLGGWVLAGRMLRPLHDIHRVARQVIAGSLDHRVQLRGYRDEFRELADTFDAMLDRLQVMMEEQRRFAANASHELRTPYAIERAVLDVALADPASVDVARLLERLDQTNRRGTETVEALLALAVLDRSQVPPTAPVDLAELSAEALRHLRPVARDLGITVRTGLEESDLDGVETLVRQLVANLVLNAVRHNTGPGGWVEVSTTSTAEGVACLRVVNSGPTVPSEVVASLTEPFFRAAHRTSAATGSGLGLSIVARVSELHGADLRIRPRAEGGLDVRVHFPPPGTPGTPSRAHENGAWACRRPAP